MSQDESLAMARRAVKDGIHTIVATPHTLNGIYLKIVCCLRCTSVPPYAGTG
ncbi:MAG: hypothetical protein JRJ21_07525 [Deltaproteobacteria bacterium]|nr:hypothetical protein [Deltaproteobacteria bacterium]